MPCNCDHLEPSVRERESQRAATLIIYALNALGRTYDSWILQAAHEVYGNPRRMKKLTVMLCDICRGMTEDEQTHIIYDGGSAKARNLAVWWEEHQAADKERLEREKADELAKKQEYLAAMAPEIFEALKKAENEIRMWSESHPDKKDTRDLLEQTQAVITKGENQ